MVSPYRLRVFILLACLYVAFHPRSDRFSFSGPMISDQRTGTSSAKKVCCKCVVLFLFTNELDRAGLDIYVLLANWALSTYHDHVR